MFLPTLSKAHRLLCIIDLRITSVLLLESTKKSTFPGVSWRTITRLNGRTITRVAAYYY